jgi:hypothetical protein
VIFGSFSISSFTIPSSFFLLSFFHIFVYPSFCLSSSCSVLISLLFSQLRRLHLSHIKWRQSNTQHIFCTSQPHVSATSKWPSLDCTQHYEKEIIYIKVVDLKIISLLLCHRSC